MPELDAASFALGIFTFMICGLACSLMDVLTVKAYEIRCRIADRKKECSKEVPGTFAEWKKDGSK